MIPLKLQIKNFVSYGAQTQTVDFSPHRLMCLAGKNGHGKSALLDAITWALWGQARKASGTSKADEGIMRLGQTHMLVGLDFMCQNRVYHVRREFAYHYGKPTSYLEFGMRDEAAGVIRPLTDKTMKATQELIEKTVGLDYECFINSAFLRQGHANEFSQKSPKDRKELLATILGLNHFENIRKSALDKAKQASSEKDHIEQFITKLSSELAQQPDLHKQLQHMSNTIEQLTAQELTTKLTLQSLRNQRAEYNQHKLSYERLLFSYQSVQENWKALHTQFIETVTIYRAIALKARTLHLPTTQELEAIEQAYADIQKSFAHKVHIQESLFSLEKEQQEHVTRLSAEQQEKATHVRQQLYTIQEKEMRYLSTKESLCNNIQVITQDYEKIKIARQRSTSLQQEELLLITTYTREKKQLERRQIFYQSYIHKQQTVLSELQLEQQKRSLIINSLQPSCPLCLQGLSSDHQHRIDMQARTRISLKEHQNARLSTIISRLERLISNQKHYCLTQEQTLAHIKKELTLFNHILQQETENRTTYEKLCAEKRDVEQELIQEQLKKKTKEEYYKELLKNSSELIINDQAYLKRAHDIEHLRQELTQVDKLCSQEAPIRNKRQELFHLRSMQEELSRELFLQEERKKNIAHYIKSLRSLKKEEEKLHTEVTLKKECLTQELEIVQQEQELSASLEKISREKEFLLQQQGAWQQQVKQQEKQAYDIIDYKNKLIISQTAYEDYTAIASALSKDGIQALLIEDALPEFEHEANNLLSLLTDNQAHLSIESLRDLRSGKTKETLDIHISDEAGIRPYELFSGGEAFRIDFALRIALSKLLARRAGATLQTLIIDEGFGSQDEEGLSRLVDALNKIQEEFAKIIVVSHLPQLKDQFPVHFLINKGPEGSMVEVIEHE